MSIIKSIGIFLFFMLCTISLQSQIYVDTDASGANTGTSWTDAFTSLKSATDLAGFGADIWIAEGTYFPTSDTSRNASFIIANGVELYGGFQGGETSTTQRDWVNNPTILSGDIGIVGTKTDNSLVIVEYPNTSTTGKLDGLIIQDGYANRGFKISGSAVMINSYNLANNGNIQFENIIFQNNYSSSNGGAVYLEAGSGGSLTPDFKSCEFINNSSGSSGGAVYNSAYGNGLITSTYTNCTFRQNLATQSGAAVFNHGGNGGSCNPMFSHCDFDSNASDDGHGGAIYNLGTGSNGDASPTILNSRFYNNSGFAAGAIYNNGTAGGNSSPEITNSTFVANFINEKGKIGGGGGIIYNNGSVSGNSSTIVTNCIVWGNKVDNDGTHIFKNVEGTPTIRYSTIDVADCNALNNSLGSIVTCGSGIQYNIDPQFVDQVNGNLRLLDSSPAINSGDNSINTASVDLDGTSRIENSMIDQGAYENASVLLPIELANFQAQLRGDDVVLKWTTLSEVNNDYFTIEHSMDVVNFETIAKIKGAGNSTSILEYETIDFHPTRGRNYYRLVQTDFDGTSTKSKIVQVEFEKGKTAIFPNPVSSVLYITTEKFEAHDIEIEIYDILGKKVIQRKVEILNGSYEVKEIESFRSGTYFVRINAKGEDTFIQKIQKL